MKWLSKKYKRGMLKINLKNNDQLFRTNFENLIFTLNEFLAVSVKKTWDADSYLSKDRTVRYKLYLFVFESNSAVQLDSESERMMTICRSSEIKNDDIAIDDQKCTLNVPNMLKIDKLIRDSIEDKFEFKIIKIGQKYAKYTSTLNFFDFRDEYTEK
ncbi:hypothetical protein BpHYR1_024574 [Brachionus plicatilis]|uniref:Uncharacterized protein n=1 Tax=Brachionus plicatilis TaxID=10195 RepID=A0A3M7Q9D3_BRAPC|nr:hypothetical protein BpHYR1_024574 [Brachionus plicatilis]